MSRSYRLQVMISEVELETLKRKSKLFGSGTISAFVRKRCLYDSSFMEDAIIEIKNKLNKLTD